MEKYDILEMIKELEDVKKPDEVIVFSVGSGRIVPKFGMRKKMKQAFDFIKNLDGFVGIHPVDLWHTLIVFDTRSNAICGRNLMLHKGIPVGDYVVPILVNKKFLEGSGLE